MSTLVDLLQDLRIPYAEHGSSPHVTQGWLGIECPWCGAGTGNYGLGVHLAGLYCTCWKCGAHSLAEVVREFTHQSWTEVFVQLKHLDRVPFAPKLQGVLKLPKGRAPLSLLHRQYLEGRRLDPDEMVQLWQLEGISLHSRLAWRVFIPIYFRGQLVSWTTRAIGNREPRYLNATPSEEGFSAKRTLLGWDFVRHSVIVTEGPFDAFRIGPGAVATFGVGFTMAQVKLLSTIPVRTICYDPGAHVQAKRLCSLLTPFPGSTYNVILTESDPGGASPRAIRKLRSLLL